MTGDGSSNNTDMKLLDAALQKKSVKLVVMHLGKKIDPDMPSIGYVYSWLEEMEKLLAKEDFVKSEYIEMRKRLYDAIEWIPDVEIRHSLRNSWYSFGKALEKKAPRNPL